MTSSDREPLPLDRLTTAGEIEAREAASTGSSASTGRRIHRRLSADEIKILARNGNDSPDWTSVLVSDGFAPERIRRSSFRGLVRIGGPARKRYDRDSNESPHIIDSTIVDCDVGDRCTIESVRTLRRYVVGEGATLVNIDEMCATGRVPFGNGVLRTDNASVRSTIDIANENGGRSVTLFDGMEIADACLWSRHRDDMVLQRAFLDLTDAVHHTVAGAFGSVASGSEVRSCRLIEDVWIEGHVTVVGANRLRNLTIKGRADGETRIGIGVDLSDGIVECGCVVDGGATATRFLLRTNATLGLGAVFIDSILGDNGTVTCAEVRNSLLFAGHEQHHNNSFLCSATLMGQSNIAAGATIGSNHNSRANDGELSAGRGFWPGLCVSLKFPTRVASYCIVAKGAYPAELNVPLPFTLVSNSEDRLVLSPAYWFRSNMYAVGRNGSKSGKRDARIYAGPPLDYDFLAPDTIGEILSSLDLMEIWAGLAVSAHGDSLERRRIERVPIELPSGTQGGMPPDEAMAKEQARIGEKALRDESRVEHTLSSVILLGAGIERSNREVEVRHLPVAYRTFRDMAVLYSIRSIVTAFEESVPSVDELISRYGEGCAIGWRNVGGRFLRQDRLDAILEGIREGTTRSWDGVHDRYWESCGESVDDRANHAVWILRRLFGSIDRSSWKKSIASASDTQASIARLTRSSREKDYTDPFRSIMYDSKAEMETVTGALSSNEFIMEVDEYSERFCSMLDDYSRMMRL